MRFLAGLRIHFRDIPERTLLIDFSRTERFIAGGTLLFYAELKRLIAYRNGAVKVRCTQPANDRGSQVLKQVGIYSLCAHHSNVKPTRHDVVHWRVAQGHLVDNSICAPAIEAFEGQLALPMINGLLGGLAEAMSNAIHHAYDALRDDDLSYDGLKDWWMFSQAKDGRLSVVFCDLGVGIPTTLPLKMPKVFSRLVLRKPIPTDADCIREAINEGRSQTGLPGRGHGLGNIIEVVENIPGGIVVVCSNRGRYDSRSDPPFPQDYSESIRGTLIYWQIPLQEILIEA